MCVYVIHYIQLSLSNIHMICVTEEVCNSIISQNMLVFDISTGCFG
jgi:hypothetical protein